MSDNGTWTATLSDGREFGMEDPTLQVEGASPWRALEALAREAGLRIAQVEVTLGLRRLVMANVNGPLVTGTHYDMELNMATGEQGAKFYRWVVSEGRAVWRWQITDGRRAWEVETTPGIPGREAMPSVAGVED